MAREYCSLSDKIKIFEQHDYVSDLSDVQISKCIIKMAIWNISKFCLNYMPSFNIIKEK